MMVPIEFPFDYSDFFDSEFVELLRRMSNGDLKTGQGASAVVGMEGNEHELTQWNASAVETTIEPAKLRSRLRVLAVLAGLNVG